mgnify:CR=1 FL=1
MSETRKQNSGSLPPALNTSHHEATVAPDATMEDAAARGRPAVRSLQHPVKRPIMSKGSRSSTPRAKAGSAGPPCGEGSMSTVNMHFQTQINHFSPEQWMGQIEGKMLDMLG